MSESGCEGAGAPEWLHLLQQLSDCASWQPAGVGGVKKAEGRPQASGVRREALALPLLHLEEGGQGGGGKGWAEVRREVRQRMRTGQESRGKGGEKYGEEEGEYGGLEGNEAG